MAFVPVPNVAQFNVRAEYYGVPVENVLHFASTTVPMTAPMLLLGAQNLGTQWVTNILPLLDNGYRMTEIFGIDLTSATGPAATDNSVADAAGGNTAGEGAPGNVAFVLTHATAMRGRSYRGRTYFVGVPNAYISENAVMASWASDLADAFSAMTSQMLDDFGHFVIVSRFHNKVPRSTGVATNVQTSFYRDLTLDTQRRRLA